MDKILSVIAFLLAGIAALLLWLIAAAVSIAIYGGAAIIVLYVATKVIRAAW